MFDRTGQIAHRVDKRSGVRERVAFVPFGTLEDQVFISSYEPPAESVGTVLICSSILADFLANYEREVNLARGLANAGLTVVRFHPRGVGNSGGDPSQVTLTSLQDEARWVAAELTTWHPELPMVFVGTRWGALAAAAAARDHGGAPLVLCEPLTDFARFFSDAGRSRAMSALASGRSKSFEPLPELLVRDGFADIVGNIVHRALFDSSVDQDARQLLAEGPSRPSLLVQFGGQDLRTANRRLEQHLVDGGWHVDTAIMAVAENWWFGSGPHARAASALNDAAQDWIVKQLAGLTASEPR